MRSIDKTACLLVTITIKGYKQGEIVYLPKLFQWVNISVQSVNDSLQEQILLANICRKDMESETMSENESSTMKKNLMQRL